MDKRSLMSKGLRRAEPDSPRPLADAVLRLIWNKKRISRADIARLGSLSRSTVSEIIKEILPSGLVSEIGEGPSRGGRRPIVLEFQDDACVILGIEMGGAHVAVALTDLRGKVLAWESKDHPVRTDPAGSRRLIEELCQRCLDHKVAREKPLVGIGLAAPSPIDPSHPFHLSSTVMPAWKGELGLEHLSKKFAVPLFIDNDANLGALAEKWWGCCRDSDHISYIKVATGIGSGHIINGDIYRGATGVAGEIGHMAIDPHGKICVCGLRGCLATMAGGEALQARANELLADHPDSPLATGIITNLTIEKAALEGDPLALQLVQEAASSLGIAVAGLLNLLNPSVVVLGGDFATLGDLLLEPLREVAASRTLVSSVAAARILASELGPQSVAIGAATLVLKNALKDSRLFPLVSG